RLARRGAVVPRGVVRGLVDARARFAPAHAQPAAVVHALEQARAGVEVTTPVTGHAAVVGKGFTHLARVRAATLAHEGQQLARAARGTGVPGLARRARVQQRQHAARHEAVVDEGVFFQPQALVAALQITGAVVAHAVVKDQVLRARRG